MDIALGILNISVSESRTAGGRALVELARSRGYRLAEVLIVDDDTYMPTAYIAERARTTGADAILAPSLEHFGVAARALPYVCALVVPEPAVPTHEMGRAGPAVCPRPRGRKRLHRLVISVAALVVVLAAIWALWPAQGSAPTFVVPGQTMSGGGDEFPGIRPSEGLGSVGHGAPARAEPASRSASPT